MKHSTFWTNVEGMTGDCPKHMVGMEKPPKMIRLQDENDQLKEQNDQLKEQLGQVKKVADRNAAYIAAQDAGKDELRRQIATLEHQMSALTGKAQQQTQSDHEALDGKRQAMMAANAKERAELARIKAALAEEATALGEKKKELDKLRDNLARSFDDLRERDAAIVSKQTVAERQQAVINGDMTSVTESLIADIVRLEEDAVRAHQRMLAVDKAQHCDKREERQHWHGIYTTATRELRAARQQLIQLPRSSTSAERWKDMLTMAVSTAMDQGMSVETIRDFASSMGKTLMNQNVRRTLARQPRMIEQVR